MKFKNEEQFIIPNNNFAHEPKNRHKNVLSRIIQQMLILVCTLQNLEETILKTQYYLFVIINYEKMQNMTYY